MTIELNTFDLSTISFETNEYIFKEIQEAKNFYKCVIESHSTAILKHVFEFNCNVYRYQHSIVYIQLKPYTIVINFSSYRKKYTINARFTNEREYVSQHSYQSLVDKYEQPKQIGVLTSKKIQDWLKYWNNIYNDLLLLQSEKYNVEQEFRDSIKSQPVVWYSTKKGYIIQGGLRFDFEITDGYISKKITIEAKNTLENFLALSQNKL